MTDDGHKETIEMQFKIEPESGKWEPFQQMLIDNNVILKDSLDHEKKKSKFLRLKFDYHQAYYDLMCACLWCGRKMYRKQMRGHVFECEKHPIAELKKEIKTQRNYNTKLKNKYRKWKKRAIAKGWGK